jgi:hypothetical protein
MLRAAEGWPVLQHDETWLYHISQDGKACPTCTPFDSNSYRGDYLLYEFPFLEVLSPFKALVHNETSFHAALRCQCSVEWVNPSEVLVQRLMAEFEAVL